MHFKPIYFKTESLSVRLKNLVVMSNASFEVINNIDIFNF